MVDGFHEKHPLLGVNEQQRPSSAQVGGSCGFRRASRQLLGQDRCSQALVEGDNTVVERVSRGADRDGFVD